MTTFQIKCIAIITMIIDHIGLFFFPHILLFRIIGRLAFPLFAWQIANGAYYTKNIEKYLSRLLLLALIAQIPFTLANQQIGSPPLYTNVVFTLFLGLYCIHILKKADNVWTFATVLIASCLLAITLNTDYGVAGIFSVIFFYLFLHNKKMMLISQAFILVVIPYLVLLAERTLLTNLSWIYMDSTLEVWGLISIGLIFLYHNRKGFDTKYLLYIVYPLQYVVIYLVKVFAVL